MSDRSVACTVPTCSAGGATTTSTLAGQAPPPFNVLTRLSTLALDPLHFQFPPIKYLPSLQDDDGDDVLLPVTRAEDAMVCSAGELCVLSLYLSTRLAMYQVLDSAANDPSDTHCSCILELA